MRRRSDAFYSRQGDWDHLRIRSLPPILSRLVMFAFARTIDGKHQALDSPSTGLVGYSGGPALTVTNEGDFTARLIRDGILGFGEAFIAGSWRGGAATGHGDLASETDAAADWLEVYARALTSRDRARSWISNIGWRWRLPAPSANTTEATVENVAYHYDLPPEFFRLFLDSTLTYSCADFSATEDLSAAQVA